MRSTEIDANDDGSTKPRQIAILHHSLPSDDAKHLFIFIMNLVIYKKLIKQFASRRPNLKPKRKPKAPRLATNKIHQTSNLEPR